MKKKEKRKGRANEEASSKLQGRSVRISSVLRDLWDLQGQCLRLRRLKDLGGNAVGTGGTWKVLRPRTEDTLGVSGPRHKVPFSPARGC